MDNLTAIGVDEISFSKGRKYITIIYDISSRKAIPISYQEGNNKESLEKFLVELGEDRRKGIKLVVSDMSRSYISAVSQYLPEAMMVIDKYHLLAEFNRCMEMIKRYVFREMATKENYFKGSLSLSKLEESRINKRFKFFTPQEKMSIKWAVLKRPANLTEAQSDVLSKLEKYNSPLFKAYLLKEQFFSNYVKQPVEQAKLWLTAWIKEARATGLNGLISFCNTLERHFEYILNYFHSGITSAAIEGVNNKIKVLKRMAYGYKDLDYFFRKIRSRFSNLDEVYLLFSTQHRINLYC